MHAGSLVAHLAHLAQDRHARTVTDERAQQIEAGSHRLGTGVIRVVDDACSALGALDLLTVTGDRKAPKGSIDLLGRHAQTIADRGGLDGIGHGLHAGNGQHGIDRVALTKVERKDWMALVVDANVACADLVVVRDTGQHHVNTRRLSERIANERRKVVLAAQNQQRREVAGGAHTLDNLGLGAGDVLAAAQDTDVGGSDLAHDGKIGVGRLGQALNLMKMVHAHLEHQDLGIGRSGKHRERHADQVVEIALRGPDAITLGEHGGEHVLGRRLANRTGNADDQAAKLQAIYVRQAQQELNGVVGQQDGASLVLRQ